MPAKKRHFISLFILLVSCTSKIVPPAKQLAIKTEVIDYSKLDYWAAHPNKNDPSDSVPAPLIADFISDTTTDVFFLHPTTYLDNKLLKEPPSEISSPLWNADITNDALNSKTDNSTILYQGSIFNKAGRIFAPRYRQANYYAYFTRDTLNARSAFAVAYRDIEQAFKYYLDHYNNGRPIIIASHSQGTTHAKLLLKQFFENKPLMKQLVVAYLVGMPVEEQYFKAIPVCEDSLQTGCFCSWRTLKEGYFTDYIKKETSRVLVTNPLSWTTTTDAVGRYKNTGSILLNFNKIIPNSTGGRIYKNVLWVNKPQFFGNVLYRDKNYHIGDYNLFYLNVRNNAAARVKAFQQKKQQ